MGRYYGSSRSDSVNTVVSSEGDGATAVYVTGVSGGVGKTTVAYNVAAELSRNGHADSGVYLLELDWVNGTLAGILDTDRTVQAMVDAVGGSNGDITDDLVRVTIDSCIATTQDGLRVIPAPVSCRGDSSSFESSEDRAAQYRDVVSAYVGIVRYLLTIPGNIVIIDAPVVVHPQLDQLASTLLSMVGMPVVLVSGMDHVGQVNRANTILVSSPDGGGGGETGYGVDPSNVHVVLNRVPNGDRYETTFEDFCDRCSPVLSGVIPDSDDLLAEGPLAEVGIAQDIAQVLENIGVSTDTASV